MLIDFERALVSLRALLTCTYALANVPCFVRVAHKVVVFCTWVSALVGFDDCCHDSLQMVEAADKVLQNFRSVTSARPPRLQSFDTQEVAEVVFPLSKSPAIYYLQDEPKNESNNQSSPR